MESFWSRIETLQRQFKPVLAFLSQGENMQAGLELDPQTLCCSICLDLLKDPVTIPCGHSYCLNCIEDHWDKEDHTGINSCPQCREMFKPRPDLEKNTILAALVEQLKKTGLQAAPADHCYAGPEDVACDFCTGRKLKAIKSCLVCLASYCEKHLQPHYDSATFKKHKLMEPSKNLQENICSHHDEVMKMFCRTDQVFICYVCPVDQHKDHDTVSIVVESTERQREVEERQGKIQQRIQDREKDVKLLQQEVEAINSSADKTVEDSEKIFSELILVIQKRNSDVKQQIRSQQETEMNRVKELQEKLEQEINELKKKEAELKQLLNTEDHTEFLKNYFMPCLGTSINFLAVYPFYVQHFNEVQKAVSETQKKVREGLGQECKILPQNVINPNLLLKHVEPKTRSGFLKNWCEITLDPNTANSYISLSEENKKATLMMVGTFNAFNPDRCDSRGQVLSRESLTGRCYWEVEKGFGGVSVVAAYKRKKSIKEEFRKNEESWALTVFKRRCEFTHRNTSTNVSRPGSTRIGVYLDPSVGILSFYSVSETMTLLHRVHTTFTEPLHAGIRLYGPIGNNAWIVKLS